jgi:hypothetical protein
MEASKYVEFFYKNNVSQIGLQKKLKIVIFLQPFFVINPSILFTICFNGGAFGTTMSVFK